MSPRIHTRKPDKRTGKISKTIAFKSLRNPSLNYYYDLFYKYDIEGKRRKIIPTNISDLLSPCALAYWIIDDCGINAYKATMLNTDSFTIEEVKLLQKALRNNFQLRTRIVEKRAGQWAIVIPIRQPILLSTIVGSYMHTSMAYKVKGLI